MNTDNLSPRPADDDSTVGQSRTRIQLISGVVAGPLFFAVATAQVLTRDGFDLARHPLSLLSVGELGWIQIANFVVTGLLVIAFSRGVRRSLRESRGSTWIPRLLAGFGLGLIVAGVFVADPENGFPVGTPEGPASAITWHGIAHGAGAVLAFDSLIVACVLMALRLKAQGHRFHALTSVVVGIALLVVPAPVSVEGIGIRLAVAIAIAFGATAVVAVWLLRQSAELARHER